MDDNEQQKEALRKVYMFLLQEAEAKRGEPAQADLSQERNPVKLKSPIVDDAKVLDIPGMYAMSEDEYRKYIQEAGVFFVDNHAILREGVTGRPLAATLEQFDILIEALMTVRKRMQPKT